MIKKVGSRNKEKTSVVGFKPTCKKDVGRARFAPRPTASLFQAPDFFHDKYMPQTYRHKHTSVSLVNYHFCWIVRFYETCINWKY